MSPKLLVYDGECPFCSRYVALVRLRESYGPVELVDARSGHPVVADLSARGYDLDEGMALIDGNEVYHGEDCIHRLALLSSPSSLFNRFNAAVFRSRRASSVLYPLLRAGRNLTLRVLGRRKLAATERAG